MPPNSTKPRPAAKRTILIVDDHPILCRGLAALIELEPDLTVSAAVATREAALEAVAKNPPDLVIVDLALEGSDGLDLVKELTIRHQKVPALVLSMHDEALYAERCLRAGARGYVSKQQLDATVLEAIRQVLTGAIYMSDTLRARLAERVVTGRGADRGAPLAHLSDRELQVFRLIGDGLSTREIAHRLHLSVKTVETHLDRIKHKLELENAAQLAQRAARWVASGAQD
jgi:DNA-binding NarL/FixJ family response regulator